MNIMYRVTLKSMLKNKRRTIVTIIGVIISVAMITAVSTFSASFSSLFRRQEIYENGDWIVSFRSIDHAKAQEVESDSGSLPCVAFIALSSIVLRSADSNCKYR